MQVCLARKQFAASEPLPCFGGCTGATVQKRLLDMQVQAIYIQAIQHKTRSVPCNITVLRMHVSETA